MTNFSCLQATKQIGVGKTPVFLHTLDRNNLPHDLIRGFASLGFNIMPRRSEFGLNDKYLCADGEYDVRFSLSDSGPKPRVGGTVRILPSQEPRENHS